MIKVAILGASGYSGFELTNILTCHPDVELACLQSKSFEGKKVNEVYPQSDIELKYTNPSLEEIDECEVVFLALPKEESVDVAAKLKTRIIDLSPAHRFDLNYTYGLSEINRDKIKASSKIANPGCYATACLLGIIPLVQANIDNIAFDCKSGYSGGGKSKNYDYLENLIPYSLTNHYQAPEIRKYVSAKFSFTPHVVNSFRGLISTIHIFTDENLEDILTTYANYYKGEYFVKVQKDIPSFKTVSNTPNCVIGGFEKGDGHYVIVSAIDNLLKGAASQAVQNMNIMFDKEEFLGIKPLLHL